MNSIICSAIRWHNVIRFYYDGGYRTDELKIYPSEGFGPSGGLRNEFVMKFYFDCVFYYVTDMERAISFYADILGLKITSRDVVTRFDIDGVLFELVPAPGETRFQGGGKARLCLKVDNIYQALREL